MGKIIAFFADKFGYVLNFIYGFVGNYGLAIILFSILIKLIMLPLSIKQQKTMKKTQKVQVKLKELQKKYENDQSRLAQETMSLYKEENVSPFSGCLSTILQFIILISIFFMVRQPLTYMLRMDDDKLDSYSQIVEDTNTAKRGYTEIAIIKEARENDEIDVDIDMNFLGLDLSNIPYNNYTDPTVYIIPGLYVISSIISMKLTTAMTVKKKKEEDNKEDIIIDEKDTDNKKNKEEEADMTAQLSKQMSIMMPIMAISIAAFAPLGMALYWLVNNILMTVERIVLNKIFSSKEEEENV